MPEFVIPADIDLGEYARPFDSVDALAAYLLDAENNSSAVCGVRETVWRWQAGEQSIASYQWRAMGQAFRKAFADLVDWRWARMKYGFECEMMLLNAIFERMAKHIGAA